MKPKARLAVVDDHPVVRRGIVDTLNDEDDLEVVAEGGSAADAIRVAESERIDLMLLDVSMPGDGLAAAAHIHSSRPHVRFAMLSIREDFATVRTALKSGARGYISKGIDATELVSCVRRILGGASYVSPDLAARLLTIDALNETGITALPVATNLTDREDQIFRLIGQGLSNFEIAQRLGLTENTVKHYITPLLHKLGVRNRTEAALLASGNGGSPKSTSS